MLRADLRKAAVEGSDDRLIRRLIDVPLLCLSDPVPSGGQGLSDYQADALYRIVDRRWDAGRPTWATANLPLDQLRDAGERTLAAPVWDRLKDGALIAKCGWRSYRRHADVIE